MLRAFKPICLLAAFVIVACTAPERPADAEEAGFASPQALLDDLYGHYAEKPAGSGVDLADNKVIETYFTPELAKLIEDDATVAAAKGDVPTLDGDPFVDAQDWEIGKIETAVGKSSDPEKTEAHVRFTNYGEAKDLKLSLVKGAKGWQIADIDWGYDKLSNIFAH
ncbi:DUF3828 domain-containing protein [Dongia sp.]|uniref:DUF3828 domain-containing protein n=1 Tax=Dongia sp. TaxID=1977262 RepID=UPI0035B46F5B